MDKTVIFDMDGVIFDTEKLVLSTWKQLADKDGIIGIEDVFYKCIGTNRDATREIVLDYYGTEFPYDEFREDASKIFHEYVSINGMPLKSGVYEIMEYLKDNNYKIGLASSTRKVIVKEELQSAGLLQYFDVVIGGDMVKRSKPEPDIFLKCAEDMRSIPENIYVIEDSYNGIKAAHRAGMKPIMVPDMVKPNEEMQTLSTAIIDNLIQVIKYLSENN